MEVNAKIEYLVDDSDFFKKGKTGEWRGYIVFEKTEKGWVVKNIKGDMYY